MNARDDDTRTATPAGEAGMACGDFATTHWSVVLLAGNGDSSKTATALEHLCRTYWYPLYAYARRQGHGAPDAQDLTQQFFAVFLEKNYVRQADRDRGRFRCFLLASFKHFLANEFHRSRTAKRGGGHVFVPWEEANPEAYYRNEPVCEASPDKMFDRAWALTLLDTAMKELQQEYVGAGKGAVFGALQGFLSGEKQEATYAQIGAELQMGESAIKMAVLRLRRRYGEVLRGEIAQTLSGAAGVEEELRHLVAALGS